MEFPALIRDASQSQPIPATPDSQQHNSRLLTPFAIFAAVLFWASAYPAIKVVLAAYTPTEVAFLRYFVASVVLVFYAIIKRMPFPKREDLLAIALSGLLGFTLYNVLLNAGETTVSAGMASFVVSSEVGFIALLARYFFGEKLSKWGWIGIVLCVCGVGIISLATEAQLHLSLGILEVFLATLAMSIYSVMQKPLLKKYSAIQLTTYSIWAGTFFLFFFAPKAIFSVTSAPIASTLAIVYMGLFPGVIAFIAWSYVLSKIPVSQAGSYLALLPVAALAISWFWLGEIPATSCLLGGVVVLFGVTLVEQSQFLNSAE